MLVRTLLGALVVVALLGSAPSALAHAGPAPGAIAPASHYLPSAGNSFRFLEWTNVSQGYGNYSGYTETDAIVGYLNVTGVTGTTVSAENSYSGTYSNNEGAYLSWVNKSTFTFSDATYDYVSGTDNQTGDNFTGVWFYLNNSDTVGAALDPLGTPMTVGALDAGFLDNGSYAKTIYAVGTGSYVRNDVYGVFNATYDWRSYYDPSTGYIVGYDYVELDSDGHGDGFVYTDLLEVTKSSYALTTASAPSTYAVTFTETGLASGAAWTVSFNGQAYRGTGASITASPVPNATYLYGVGGAGYTVSPSNATLTVDGQAVTVAVAFHATSSAASPPILLYAIVAVVVVVILLVIVALVLARRRGPRMPRHSVGGMPAYGPPLAAPPPISLQPTDQPRIQQVVVKEVVKVKCQYCGSLIDSTAPKCPFCGATRS